MLLKVPSSLTEWDLPRTFLALVNTRSSDLAAGELGVSVATLKRRMARLEDIVGTKLYTGYENNFVLTEEGVNIVTLLLEVDDVIGGIKPSIGSGQFSQRPMFSVWMPAILFEMFLTPLLEEHAAVFRRFHLVSRSGEMPEVSQTFQHDIALTHYGSDSTHVVNFDLGVHQTGFGASPAYLQKYGQPTRANLGDHHFVLVSDYRLIRRLWVGLEGIQDEVGSLVEVDSTAACHVLAKRGGHFTLVTQWSSPGHYEPCPSLPQIEMPVILSVNKRLLDDPDTQEIIDIFCESGRKIFEPRCQGLRTDLN